MPAAGINIIIQTLTVSICTASSAVEGLAGIHPLVSLWQGADLVTRSSLVLLLTLFVGSWYLLFSRLHRQFVLARHARTVDAGFWIAPNLYEALKQLEPESTFRRIAQAGLEAATHLDGRLTDRIRTSEWIVLSLDRAVRELRDSLHDRIGILWMIAPAAVAVGLFGAIWSLCRAFTGIEGRGGAQDLAPIGEALLMTALGLAVALPATAGYNWLIRRNARVTDQAREFASEIRALLLSPDRPALEDSGDSPAPAL